MILPSRLYARPSFIGDITPPELSIIPLQAYIYEHEITVVGDRVPELGYSSSICVRLIVRNLVQPGDDFIEEDIIQRFDFRVDGILRAIKESSWGGTIIEGSVKSNAPTSRWVEPGNICWHAPLESGIHEVVLRFTKTDGTITSYTWYFVIDDDKDWTPLSTNDGTPRIPFITRENISTTDNN